MLNITQDPCLSKIDGVLVGVLGEKGAQIIYHYIEVQYSLKADQFCSNLDILMKGLHDCLDEGAFPVGELILSELTDSGLIKH